MRFYAQHSINENINSEETQLLDANFRVSKLIHNEDFETHGI